MSINLSKGDKIDLKKSNPGLSNILVGLGWDPVQQSGGGFFKSLFGGGQADIDCDASVFMLNQEGKLSGIKDLIYFGNLKSACKSVLHTGDNLTGEGTGDDEQILVNLDKVPSNIHKLLFVVNIYNCVDRKQHFGMIENAYIRVEDQGNKIGAIYRKDGSWQFKAIGEGTKDAGLKEVMQNLDRIECAYGI